MKNFLRETGLVRVIGFLAVAILISVYFHGPRRNSPEMEETLNVYCADDTGCAGDIDVGDAKMASPPIITWDAHRRLVVDLALVTGPDGGTVYVRHVYGGAVLRMYVAQKPYALDGIKMIHITSEGRNGAAALSVLEVPAK